MAKEGITATSAPLLLRSQTSTVQIRVMEKTKPPVRIISLGRVYRPDTADATHYPMFHQIEGLLIDKHVTMADLKSVLRLFARSYFGGDVHIRFRPSFFPFTEPSVEVDMSWHDSWIEMGGAGMVDPHVLRAVGHDPEEVTGFAFGLGVERVCAPPGTTSPTFAEFYRKNDVRFLEQFLNPALPSRPVSFPSFRSLPTLIVSLELVESRHTCVLVTMPSAELERRLMLAGLNHEETRDIGGDLAIDLEVTSNRPDCLGHIGVAREVAVLFERELKLPRGRPARNRPAGRRVTELAKVAHRMPASFVRATRPA